MELICLEAWYTACKFLLVQFLVEYKGCDQMLAS